MKYRGKPVVSFPTIDQSDSAHVPSKRGIAD